ncbi:hypothetical protein C5Y96_16635 [Blastopirellula marina]|uniref:HTH cro/C1-type domain-containing protein n=1 Tax=Blastopirellula marina TaxID=124 RepID=A0A2S8F776_9BACT|nr:MULTISPECIES: helix-turn-helix domain-containing protein [Pirellulaceae]PQO28003.1 hypothetical protein C5Y96_16635 [Blastopirellula marina]RCS48428.1 helix-turn-helix domain-containing protein [Bremerella cremea]
MNQNSNSSNKRCNGQQVASLRNQLGWTQEVLAVKAGYSDRLIRKAEAGQSVSAATLTVLAQTFQQHGLQVTAADLEMEAAAIARRFIECMYTETTGVIDAMSEFISDDIVIHFSGDPQVFPFAGTHEGKDAARRAFQLFYSVIQPPDDMTEMNDMRFLPTQQGALVWGNTWAHPIGMPMKEPIQLAIRMDFRDGLMVLFDDRFDTAMGFEHFCRANQVIV